MLVLFGLVFFAAFFGGLGYMTAMLKFDAEKPKLTAVQIKGELSDFLDLKGRLDADGFATHLATLLLPENNHKREIK